MNSVMIFARKNKFYLFTNLFLPRYQYTCIHVYMDVGLLTINT